MQRRVALTLGAALVLTLVAAGAAGQAAFGGRGVDAAPSPTTALDGEDATTRRPRGPAFPASTEVTFAPGTGGLSAPVGTSARVRGRAQGTMPTASVTPLVSWSSPTPATSTATPTTTSTSSTADDTPSTHVVVVTATATATVTVTASPSPTSASPTPTASRSGPPTPTASHSGPPTAPPPR